MKLKLLGMVGALLLCGFFTGCTSPDNGMRSYSIQSYQGPMPMDDYRRINPETYGVPVQPR
jgi:hypothetical protein